MTKENGEQAKKDAQEEDQDTLSEALDIGDEIGQFVAHIDGLMTTLPMSMFIAELGRHAERKRKQEFLEQRGELLSEDGSKKEFRVKPEDVQELTRIDKRLSKLEVGVDILPKSMLVALVSQFDFLLGRLVRWLYLNRPEMLAASERQIQFSQLLEFGSIEVAREYLLEKEVETLLRKSHTEQFEWLEKKLGIPLRKDLPVWPTFIETTERRNLLVHTGGRASHQYLAACTTAGVNLDPSIQPGTVVPMTREYFETAARAVYEIGVKLGQVIWRKIAPHDLKRADASLIQVTYSLLQSEQWTLAQTLLDFSTGVLKKHHDDNMRRVFVINRAQSYKWSGDDEATRRIIDEEDWTACGADFRIAIAVLRGENDDAAKLMRTIGAAGEVKEKDYVEWPLFRVFRETEQFATAFQEVFGKPITEVSETAPLDQLGKLTDFSLTWEDISSVFGLGDQADTAAAAEDDHAISGDPPSSSTH